MAKSTRSRSKRLVLDIGSSAVRLCELTPTREGLQLTRYLQREIPLDPNLDKESKEQARKQALQELLKEARVRTRKTIFGIPGQSVFTRTRALPPVPEHKVTQIVRYEIQQQIPFSLDQIALDYQVLARTEAGGYEVLMTASKEDVVEQYIDLIKSVKRTVDTVDICPLAAYNWAKQTGQFGEQGECVALVDIGAKTTDIVIEAGNQFRFTRSLNVGGNDVTQGIAQTFGKSFAEAERLKRERAFAPTGDPQKDGKGGEAVGQVLTRMVNEIGRSFTYFRSQAGGASVNRVVLCGGGAGLRNLAPFLQRELGVEVRLIQPLAGLAVGPAAQDVNQQPERAVTALGLGLRAVAEAPLEINLIPPRVQEMTRSKEQVLYWGLSLATLALIVATIIPVHAAQDQAVRDNIEELQSRLRSYAPDLAAPGTSPTARSEVEEEFAEVEAQVDAYREQVEQLDQVYQYRLYWVPLVAIVNEHRPEGLWLSQVSSTYIGDDAQQQGGGMGGMGGGMGGPGGGMGGQQDGYIQSTGFPGIAPGGGRGGGMGGMGGGGLGSMGGMGGQMGGMGGMDGPMGDADDMEVQPPPDPNGMIVRGVARDWQTILDFVQALRDTGVFVEGGVHFSEAFADVVYEAELYNLRIMDDTDRPGGGGGAGMGGGMSGGRTDQMGRGNQGNRYRMFRVDLQFAGEAPDDITGGMDEQGPGGGPGGPGSMGGPGGPDGPSPDGPGGPDGPPGGGGGDQGPGAAPGGPPGGGGPDGAGDSPEGLGL
ncbi:MAG: type IV pilus assembly protein PilM [Candidatus Hydrogenedentota bacterium]